MKIIVGLGNPEKKYENTRHNVGFSVMDALAKKCGVTLNGTKFNAQTASLKVQGETVLFMKPLTYMNASGEAVAAACSFYHVEPNNILIIHDDMDIPVGRIRIRKQGSGAGQKGMQSIIQLLGTSNLPRIRVGIGKNPIIPVVDYVLGKPTKEEQPLLEEALRRATDAAEAWITHPLEEVMNQYNTYE